MGQQRVRSGAGGGLVGRVASLCTWLYLHIMLFIYLRSRFKCPIKTYELLFTAILDYCRTEMKSYSSDCCLKTSRNTCPSFTPQLWVWLARDLGSSTEGPEVFSSLLTIKDIFLTSLKTGK